MSAKAQRRLQQRGQRLRPGVSDAGALEPEPPEPGVARERRGQRHRELVPDRVLAQVDIGYLSVDSYPMFQKAC